MSSSVTKEAIQEGKVLVHIAENGHSFNLECDGNTPVEAVMQFIESVSGISFNDQLVLCLDMKLEPQRQLSAYKLPSEDPYREVFIFNKVRLQNNSTPPPPEQVDVLEIAQPPIPSSTDDPHPLDDAPDPALKALPSYERQFRCHYQRGYVIYSRTQARIQTCERFLREQKVQERALDVARSNLEQYYRVINQNYVDFMKRYSQQHRIHSDLVEKFGRDIDRLRSIELHPALQTNTRKTLLDFVKGENPWKVADNCNNSHRQFENKVSQFKQMFGEVKRKVEDLFSCRAPSNVRNLELTIKEYHRYISEQKSIMQSLSKDVSTVKKLVDDCISCQLSSSLRPHDAVSALGPMYEVHDKNHLPNMQACDNSIAKGKKDTPSFSFSPHQPLLSPRLPPPLPSRSMATSVSASPTSSLYLRRTEGSAPPFSSPGFRFPSNSKFFGAGRVSLSSRPRKSSFLVAAKKQTYSNLDDLLAQSDKPVLVDFYATWCGPCQFMVPILNEVSIALKEKIQVVKIDTEKYPSIADKYRIEALPTFILFKAGVPCDRFEGALTADQLIQRIEDSLKVKQ